MPQGDATQPNDSKKFGLVWEEKPEDIVARCETDIPVLEEVKGLAVTGDDDAPQNLIIEGDNFHALSILKYTHSSKFDICYIDPPYNTGSSDGFRYNDRWVDKTDAWRHSKWLSFMSKRLHLAKDLLKRTGVIFISIDHNELHYLKALCDEIFGEVNFIGQITWINKIAGRQTSKTMAGTHEFILAYAMGDDAAKEWMVSASKMKTLMPQMYRSPNYEEMKDEHGKFIMTNQLYNTNSKFNERTSPTLVFVIHYNPDTGDIKFSDIGEKVTYDGFTPILPHPSASKNTKFHAWRWSRQKILNEPHNLYFCLSKKNNQWTIFTKRRDYDSTRFKNIVEINGIHGNNEIAALGLEFNNPKPKELIKLLIGIADKKDALVLDFFAGSGTTGHAVLDLNGEDNGRRRFVLCTNNEGNIARNVCRPRIQKVIKGYQYTDMQYTIIFEKTLSPSNLSSVSDSAAFAIKKHEGKYDKILRRIEGGTLRIYGAKKVSRQQKSMAANLKYFKTAFVPASHNDSGKARLLKKADDMICVKEGTFTLVKSTSKWKIFRDGQRYTSIIHDEREIPAFKEFASARKGKFAAYIFSLDEDDFSDEFSDMSGKISPKTIPGPILNIYKRIFKHRSLQ